MVRKGKRLRKPSGQEHEGNPIPAFAFKISKKLREELRADEQEKASAWLWDKSDGRCALCGELLPLDASEIEADHRIPRSGDGPTQLTNLFLAHRYCNRRRGNLPFEIGAKMASFFAWAERMEEIDFGDVLSEYVPDHGKLPAYKADSESGQLDFGEVTRSAELFIDPATLTKYFFTLVPTSYILNDSDSQPRHIFPDHVRALAQDFLRHPVHEPSNVRLVDAGKGRVQLLQFDGQHKTTAQILMGRTEVPIKVYVRPDFAMLQELVIAIQQGIKKRPLSTSDTLRKLGDVMRDLLEKYVAPSGGHRSEQGLISAQPADRRREVKRIFLQDCMRGILMDEECELKDHISAGRLVLSNV